MESLEGFLLRFVEQPAILRSPVCVEDGGSIKQCVQEQLGLYGTARTPLQQITTEAEG
jgi:hypothetical protein